MKKFLLTMYIIASIYTSFADGNPDLSLGWNALDGGNPCKALSAKVRSLGKTVTIHYVVHGFWVEEVHSENDVLLRALGLLQLYCPEDKLPNAEGLSAQKLTQIIKSIMIINNYENEEKIRWAACPKNSPYHITMLPTLAHLRAIFNVIHGCFLSHKSCCRYEKSVNWVY